MSIWRPTWRIVLLLALGQLPAVIFNSTGLRNIIGLRIADVFSILFQRSGLAPHLSSSRYHLGSSCLIFIFGFATLLFYCNAAIRTVVPSLYGKHNIEMRLALSLNKFGFPWLVTTVLHAVLSAITHSNSGVAILFSGLVWLLYLLQKTHTELIVWLKMRADAILNRCNNCGYSLMFVDSERCPECGGANRSRSGR